MTCGMSDARQLHAEGSVDRLTGVSRRAGKQPDLVGAVQQAVAGEVEDELLNVVPADERLHRREDGCARDRTRVVGDARNLVTVTPEPLADASGTGRRGPQGRPPTRVVHADHHRAPSQANHPSSFRPAGG